MANDPSAELLEPETYRMPDLECDVVMKGGITSGVVYPLAVCELARRYRLRSVGGASAGAIAAVAAAAAEHGRYSASGGFSTLAALPSEVASDLPHLFQPQRGTRSIFRLLEAMLTKPQGWTGKLCKLAALLGWYLVALLRSGRYLLLGILPAAAIASIAFGLDESVTAAWAPGLVLAAAASAAVAALLVARRTAKACLGLATVGLAALAFLWGGGEAVPFALWVLGLVTALAAGSLLAITLAAGRSIAANSFGLITGTKPSVPRRGATVEPLSDWLHEVVNEAAGRTAQDAPLTFGDLVRGRRGDGHEVRLVVMTTCVTQSRSYRIPNDFTHGRDFRERWFFDEGELEKVLPKQVVAHLVESPPPSPQDKADAATWAWLQEALAPLRPLPEPADWPIVMAARMSLSFPVLVSAVPLRKVDWSLRENAKALSAWRDPSSSLRPRAERCWFSDGGITSNFPVHFFDSLLPRRPTFGINLRGFHPNRAWAAEPGVDEVEKVYRPPTNSGGMDEWWTRFDEGKNSLGALVSFLGTIKTTALNWGDNEQMKVPGYRDRVAHISHTKGEGGLNLRMPPPIVESLSERGRIAGAELREGFTTPATAERITDWRNHKWVRLRTSTALLDEALRSILLAYDDGGGRARTRTSSARPQRAAELQALERREGRRPAAVRGDRRRRAPRLAPGSWRRRAPPR